MILDNRQTDIDRACESLAESLDYFYDNTSRLYAPAREVLTPCFEKRRADTLALRRMSSEALAMLPRGQNDEWEEFRWLWSRLKSVVKGSQQVILREMREHERTVMVDTAKAMAHRLPDEMDQLLERIFLSSRRVLKALYDAQTRLDQQRSQDR